MKKLFKTIFAGFLVMALPAMTMADDVIKINKPTSHLIPVSISGFPDEVTSVLKFDLAVLGIEVTEPADYAITGKDDGRIEATLTQTGVNRPIFVRAYAGGNERAQAHALANDIVKELRGTAPIFQTKIAFRLSHGISTEIAIADYDGFNPVVVTHDNVLVEEPTWVPGRRILLYPSWMNDKIEIYEHNLATGERRVFAGYPGPNLGAAVSPDGQKVALILSKSGSPNLYVCDMDGSNLKQLTHTKDDDSSPTWSADSREICFVCRHGRAILEKVSIDGGEATPVRVSGVYGNLTSPDWSPDGSKIAFTSGSGNFSICVMPSEGGEAEKLVAGEDPCWAPNSRTIIFTQRRSGRRVLCLLDVPTKHVKDVRQISGSCSEPSWAR
jgi:TolB protein